MDTLSDKIPVLYGRLFGQIFQHHRPASSIAWRSKHFCPATVHHGRGRRTKRRTSWTQVWTKLAGHHTKRAARQFVREPYIIASAPDKIPYFVDTPAGQKSSTQTYPQPLLSVLSEPYFVDARPYIIPSMPYIVPSMPYIVAKSIRQPSESIAVRAPKTSIKLRKPIKTPAGHFSVSFEGQSPPRAVPHTDVVPASTGNAVIFSVETSPSSPSRLKTSENGSCYVLHICANAKPRRLLVVVRRRLGRHGFQSEVQCVARKAANVRVRR